MLIRHLEFFVTLAEEGHFGRAADLCGVTQPALSLAIRKLEEDLGTVLILRGQRFMGLTAEGEKVLGWGRRILSDFGNLRDDLDGRRRGGLIGRLRFGVVASAMPLVPVITARFEERNPMARVAVTLLSAGDIDRGIADLALDGGLVWLNPTPAKAKAKTLADRTLPLRREKAVFACRRDHPFASLPSVGWADAVTQPLCLADDVQGADLPEMGTAVACTSLDGVLAHLRSGLWCSIVGAGFAGLLARDDEVVLRELDGAGADRMLGLRLPDRDPPTPMMRALRQCVESLLADGTFPGPAPGFAG